MKLNSPPPRLLPTLLGTALLAVTVCAAGPAGADEANAKKLLKAMSDYVGKLPSMSFEYDAALEVVTTEDQTLALLSSGAVDLTRPDKLRATRTGGFADIETTFDGKTLTLLGKGANLYTQVDIPGSVEHLVDELRDKYHRPLPAADLLLSNSYDELIQDVTDSKDLGSGVVGGTECDHVAFRKPEIDFQVWIAQGDKPYPCRFSVTTRSIAGHPQYTVQIRNWKSPAASSNYAFNNTTGATKIDLKDLQEKLSDLPANFTTGAAK